MAPAIRDLRLAVVLAETSTELLDGPLPVTPMGFLGRIYSYTPRFRQLLQAGPADPLGLTPPWHDPHLRTFWTDYLARWLKGGPPAALDPSHAWTALVPMRAPAPAQVRADWWPGSFDVDAFYYPHAIGLVVTSRLVGQTRTLAEAVDLAHKLRKHGKLRVRMASAKEEVELTLADLVEACLAALRVPVRGQGAAPGSKNADTPFTVFTVVRGEAANLMDEPNEEVCRALQAVTTWSPTYQNDALPELASVQFPKRTQPPPKSHVVHYSARGRAVWFPALFAPQPQKLFSLACYHKNLVAAALQVESLAGLVLASEQWPPAGVFKPPHQNALEQACEVLARMYVGEKDGPKPTTYRSWSARAHIADNYLAPLNAARAHLGKPALA